MKKWRFFSFAQQIPQNIDFSFAFCQADLKCFHQLQEHWGEALGFSPLCGVALLSSGSEGPPCTHHRSESQCAAPRKSLEPKTLS